MIVFKYRQNFAHGPGDWEYTDKWLEESELRHHLDSEYDWSDKYRGCDIERVDSPPEEIVDKWIDEAIRKREYLKSVIEKYKKLYAKKRKRTKSEAAGGIRTPRVAHEKGSK